MSAKPIVGYWNSRGNGHVVRYLLAYLGVDFEDRRYDLDVTGKKSEWFTVKHTLGLDFPNMPYLIDGDVKLTQTLAIIRYLGRKYDLNGSSPEEKLRISLMEQQVVDLNSAFFALSDDPNCDKLKEAYIAELPSKIALLSDYLRDDPFVAGSDISYVDFWLYEYLVKIKVFAPKVFNVFDNLKRFVDRIESLPRLSTYIKQIGPMPFCRPNAKWNAVY